MTFNIRLAYILLLGAFLLVVAGVFPGITLAHEGGPQLILQNNQVAPGEAVEISGANLGTDLVVRVELAANNTTVVLGEAVCDGHGDFTQTFVLPEDLPQGTYTMQAIDTSVPDAEVILASTPVRISTSGWLGQLGSNALIAIGVLALIAVALVVGLSIRQRQRSDMRKQRHATQ